MQVTVTIPDELAAEAEARGLALDAFVEKLIAERTVAEETLANRREAVAAMRSFTGKYHVTLGDTDLRSTTHEGHKY